MVVAGWKTGLILAEKKMSQAAVEKELAKHYKTSCSMKTAISRINTELKKKNSKVRLRPSRDNVKKCVSQTRENTEKRNRRPLSVNADELLEYATKRINDHENTGLYELAIALLIVSGRRTIEIMNGKSSFKPIPKRPYSTIFHGQAKTKNISDIPIPLLVPYEAFIRALNTLRKKQPSDIASFSNKKISQKYQSGLRQYFFKQNIFKKINKVHDLRGIYAHICLKNIKFTENKPADTYIVTRLLGDKNLSNSLSYMPYNVKLKKKIPLGRWDF